MLDELPCPKGRFKKEAPREGEPWGHSKELSMNIKETSPSSKGYKKRL
jgi:hypothetical protein